MEVKFTYEQFTQLITQVSSVLKLDKKLNTETRVITLEVPKIEGKGKINVYAFTHSMRVLIELEDIEIKSDRLGYVEVNLASIQKILATFKGSDIPDNISLTHEVDDHIYRIFVARMIEKTISDTMVFTQPYTAPAIHMIPTVTESIVKAEGNYITERRVKEKVKEETSTEVQEEKPLQFVDMLQNQLNGLIPLFKSTNQMSNSLPYVQMSTKKRYMETLTSLTLYDNKGFKDITGIKVTEEVALLLHIMTKKDEFVYFNNKEDKTLVIKTDKATYIADYKTRLKDYREVLDLVDKEHYIKLKREDLISKLKRLSLTQLKIEVNIDTDEARHVSYLKFMNFELEQQCYIYGQSGYLQKHINFNLIYKIIEEILPPLENSKEEFIYMYFGRTREGAWTIKLCDEKDEWQTYLAVEVLETKDSIIGIQEDRREAKEKEIKKQQEAKRLEIEQLTGVPQEKPEEPTLEITGLDALELGVSMKDLFE